MTYLSTRHWFFRFKGTTKEERIETQNKQFILNPRIFHSFSSCVHCKDIFDNRRYGLFDNASTISILMHMFLFSWSYLRNNIIVFIWTRRVGDKRESFCCATNFVFFLQQCKRQKYFKHFVVFLIILYLSPRLFW